MVLFITNLQAAGVADLKAANAAAEKGIGDEAIQLFTQALPRAIFQSRINLLLAKVVAVNTPPRA